MRRWVRDWLRIDSVLGPQPQGMGREEARFALLSTFAGFIVPAFSLFTALYVVVCVIHLAFQPGVLRWWMAGASSLSFALFGAGALWARSGRLRPGQVGWFVFAGALVVFGQSLLHAYLSPRFASSCSGHLAHPAAEHVFGARL